MTSLNVVWFQFQFHFRFLCVSAAARSFFHKVWFPVGVGRGSLLPPSLRRRCHGNPTLPSRRVAGFFTNAFLILSRSVYTRDNHVAPPPAPRDGQVLLRQPIRSLLAPRARGSQSEDVSGGGGAAGASRMRLTSSSPSG